MVRVRLPERPKPRAKLMAKTLHKKLSWRMHPVQQAALEEECIVETVVLPKGAALPNLDVEYDFDISGIPVRVDPKCERTKCYLVHGDKTLVVFKFPDVASY